MKIYFLSSKPCALTLNGAYFGLTDRFERYADIALADRMLVTFTPENALPISFFLTEDIRFAPPAGCEVYLLKNAIAIYAYDFPPRDLTLIPVAQARDNDTLVSVFFQGALQLSIESPRGFFVRSLPPSLAPCEIEFHSGLVFLKAADTLAVFTKKAEQVFLESVLSYTVENDVLSARLPLLERLGRVLDGKWRLQENGCERVAFSLLQARTENGETDAEKIQDELLPYAFFESVLIGADVAQMLADELLPQKDQLVAFLGDFVSVTPTESPNVCALIRKKRQGLFEATYFTVTVENGKITDIQG